MKLLFTVNTLVELRESLYEFGVKPLTIVAKENAGSLDGDVTLDLVYINAASKVIVSEDANYQPQDGEVLAIRFN